jgi:hypothetical protein
MKRKNTFTVERLVRDEIQVITFGRGEWVKAYISAGQALEGEIVGISGNLARVGSIWFPFGAIYKAERPAPIQRPTVALSKCISSLNAKFGADLTDADRVPADWRTA